MVFATTTREFGAMRIGRSGFWSFSRFLPAIFCSVVIVPAVFALHGEMKPALVRSGQSNALSISHQNWGRVDTLQDIDVRVERSKGRPVKLYLDNAFAQNFAIERTLPLPQTITAEGGGQVFTFDAPVDADLRVSLTLRPLTWGRSEVQLRSDVPGIMIASSTLSELILP